MKRRFQDKSFLERLEDRGKTSEAAFDWWAAQNGVAIVAEGFDNPPFKHFKYVPRNIRQRPDRYCEDTHRKVLPKIYRKRCPYHFYVEVKSVGRDRTIKIKDTSIDSLNRWKEFGERPVFFFFYDSSLRRYSDLVPLNRIDTLQYTEHKFPDGPSYRAFNIDLFTWHKVPDHVRFEGEPSNETAA